MEKIRSKEFSRNTTLDCLRLVFAFFIIALHTNPLAEYSAFISYFPSQVLSRLGVSFFSLLAGYYFFNNFSKEKYKNTIKRYFCSYSIWSALYLVFQIVLNLCVGGQNYFQKI